MSPRSFGERRLQVTGPIPYRDHKGMGQVCESNDCPQCRGAATQSRTHFSLGVLRIRLGSALGLDPITTQQLNFETLQERHREAGFPPLPQ